MGAGLRCGLAVPFRALLLLHPAPGVDADGWRKHWSSHDADCDSWNNISSLQTYRPSHCPNVEIRCGIMALLRHNAGAGCIHDLCVDQQSWDDDGEVIGSSCNASLDASSLLWHIYFTNKNDYY